MVFSNEINVAEFVLYFAAVSGFATWVSGIMQNVSRLHKDSLDINKVRASVHQQCGSKVLIQLDRGRNKVDIQEGVIQNAYPSVFTVLVDDEREKNPPQLLSFSYTDIITKDIRMKLC